MSSGYTFTAFESYIDLELPIELSLNIYNLVFELKLEIGYNVEHGTDVDLGFEIHNFSNPINYDRQISEVLYSPNTRRPLIGVRQYTFSGLFFTNKTSQNIIIRFITNNRSFTDGVITLQKFSYRVKDFVTNKYYSSFKSPEYKYSYNTSVSGLINNPDKNAVHIFLNEKYKNLLVLINQNIPMNIDWKSMNNIDLFTENYGLYYGKTKDEQYAMFPLDDLSGYNVNVYSPNKIVASNYIKTINNINDIITFDTNIYYHYIDKDGNYASTQMTYFNNSTFNELPNWINKFPPFLLNAGVSDQLLLYKKPYTLNIHPGPNKNIKDQYIVYDKGNPIYDVITDQPLATVIDVTNVDKTIGYTDEIKRFSGYYEPITKDIPLFTPSYYWNDDGEIGSFEGNYKFNLGLETFGTVTEMMYSKVNEYINVLKLRDVTENSIFPILDEVGLSQTSRNIFSSPWDSDYYVRTLNEIILFNNTSSVEPDDNIITTSAVISDVILNGLTTIYSKGMTPNIYGSTRALKLPNSKLTYSVTFDNLSNHMEIFNYVINYQSSQRTYFIESGTTGYIFENESRTINPIIDRPIEINDSNNYEEFTKWNIVVEIYTIDVNGMNDKLLDFNNSVSLNVYNDIIKFSLSNPTPLNEFYQKGETIIPIYVDNGNLYDYGITINETLNKLKNVKYNFNLYLEKGEKTNTWDTLGSSTDILNSTKTLKFTTEVPINDLDYNANELRRLRFNVMHNYMIENEPKYDVFDEKIETLYVSRTQEVPILSWVSFPDVLPPINIFKGACDYSTHLYKGDTVLAGISILNTGGKFVGTAKVIFSLRENGVNIFTKSLTQDISLEKGESTTTEFRNVTLGPTKLDGTPIITYSYKNYEVRMSSSLLSSSTKTDNIPGVNDTTPNCN